MNDNGYNDFVYIVKNYKPIEPNLFICINNKTQL